MTKILEKPEIKELNISSINIWEDNPRTIDQSAFLGLRKSMELFGYVDLVLVNKRNMTLINGHARIQALKECGAETVLCVMIDADELMHKAMAVSINNQEIMGYFNNKLMPILEEIRQSMPEDYLDLRLGELREEYDQLEPEKTGLTLPDDIPETPKQSITKIGDLWILGNHRLLCGDSTNPEHVSRLMDGHTASLLATDPPYFVDYTGKNRPGGGKDWTDLYHEIDIEDSKGFIHRFIVEALKHSKGNAAVYVWHASRRTNMICDVMNELDILIHQQIVWVKPCSLLTFSIYPWRHEPCMFGWKKGSKPFFRSARKSIGSVWEIGLLRSGNPEDPEYYSDIWEVDWEGKKRNTGLEHPTVKPTEIFAIPIRVHTKPGDVCYEPFSGSGSQIIAAERVNRKCFAMELEPIFCDVAVRRWEDFTGNKAVRA